MAPALASAQDRQDGKDQRPGDGTPGAPVRASGAQPASTPAVQPVAAQSGSAAPAPATTVPPAAPPPGTSTPSSNPELLDPNTPLAPMPGIDVPWPELGKPIDISRPAVPTPVLATPLPDAPSTPGETTPALATAGEDEEQNAEAATAPLPAPPAQAQAAGQPGETPQTRAERRADRRAARAAGRPNATVRYTVTLEGIDSLDGGDRIRTRFGEFSALDKNDSDPANVAQINRRAKTDVQLLDRLLRIEGYYDAVVIPVVSREQNDRLSVTLSTEAGEVYHFGQVSLPGLETAIPVDQTQFRTTFAIQPGDVVKQDRIEDQTKALTLDIGETGYAFAKVGEPDLLIDHDRVEGDLTVPVTLGGKYDFGHIIVRKGDVFGRRSEKHLYEIARFRPGDLYKASLTEDLRRAVIATGLVSRVTVEPVKSSDPGRVDLALSIDPAPPRTISGELGYGTGEGFRAAATWEHRNLFPPEGALILQGVAGTREQLASATFRRNNWKGRDRILTFAAFASHRVTDAYDAKTVSLSGGFERKTTLLFQKEWTYSLGAEVLYTAERALFLNTGNQPADSSYTIGALHGTLNYDGTDDLLDPHRGFRVGGMLSPEGSFSNGFSPYVRAQLDGSAYQSLTSDIVLAQRVRLGTIVGASIDEIAPSRRNYAGGGGSVRGYGYQRIGPLYTSGNPIGGRGLAELSVEARIRLRKLFGGNFGVVPFIDAGSVSTSEVPDLTAMRFGVGIGVRYYSNFGPIRIDIATPLNRRPGDSAIGVYVSLGQAF